MATEETLRHWVGLLCARGHRVTGSPECRAAAEALAKGMEGAGLDVATEEFTHRPSHPTGLVLHYSLFLLAGLLAVLGAPALGLPLAALAMVSAYGSETGKFDLFNLLQRPRLGANVVGRWNMGGKRRVILMAHYDGTRAGRVFEPHRARRFSAASKEWPFHLRSPTLPLNIGVGAVFAANLLALGGPGPLVLVPALYGVVAMGFGVLVMADWARATPIAAASDNGTGAALLLAVAERLRAECSADLEVWLVATDAEEVGLNGAKAFCHRHRSAFREKPTLLVNVDTVGSGRICRITREGGYILPLGLRYPPEGAEAVAAAARLLGRPPLPAEEAPVGTDGQILLRNGLRAVTLLGLTEEGYSEHYHWTTDVPENVDYKVAADAVEWAWAIARAWTPRSAS